MDVTTASLSGALGQHPELMALSYIEFARFLHCTSALKDDILQLANDNDVIALNDAAGGFIVSHFENSQAVQTPLEASRQPQT